MHSKWTRLLSMVLCLAMLLSYMPTSVFATDEMMEESHVHEYVPNQFSATCTEDGYTVYTCSSCGDSFTDYDDPCPGHSYHYFPEWSEDYSICTVTRLCTRDESHTDTASAESTSERGEPECDWDGYIYYTAEVTFEDGEIALESTEVTIPATGHSYDSVVTPPTCEDGGYTTYTCSACGDSYEDSVVPAPGHSYTNGTCTTCGADDPDFDGVITGECGENLTWTYADGVLTISGEGPMADYVYNYSPWIDYVSDITSVIIEDGVTSIGNYAFYYCENMISLSIGNTVESIGKAAFSCCRMLPSVILPDSVKTLGESAFGDCVNLAELDLGNGLTTIGMSAFVSCYKKLTSVRIPEGVTTIPANAFYSCNKLATLHIPESVTTIGSNAFGVTALANVYYPGSATKWGQIAIDGGNSELTNARKHFDGVCNHLNVTVPGYAATCTDTGLTDGKQCSICGETTTEQTIISVTDHNYSSVITEPTCSEGGYTTYTCSACGDTYTGDNTDAAGHSYTDGACTVCGEADPDYTATIGGSCGDNLTWTFADGILTISGEGDMYDYGTDTMPWATFRSSITSIVIEEGVTSIGYHAFDYTDFESSFTSVSLPSTLEYIWEYAFYECTSLESITIPEAVTYIDLYAFKHCDSLTSVTIPKNVSFISSNAFAYCDSLENVYVAEENERYCDIDGVLFNKDGTELHLYPYGRTATSYAIPDSVTSVEDGAFDYCTSLTEVTIPDTVTYIGGSAFRGCSLSAITLPAQLETIAISAFYACPFTTVTIPASVKYIYNQAFENCSDLSTIYFVGDAPMIVDTEDQGAFRNVTATVYYPENNATYTDSVKQNYDGTLTWTAYTPDSSGSGSDGEDECAHVSETVPAVPPSCTESGLTEGSKCTLCGDILVEQTEVPASHSYADGICSVCGEVDPDSDLLTYGDFGYSVTYRIYKDGTCVFSGTGATWNQHAAYYETGPMYVNRDNITKVVIEDGITSLGANVFMHVNGIKEVEIADSVTSIGEEAFYSCYNLETVKLPKNLTSIGEKAFYNTGIKEITIPEGITYIASYTFQNCSSLQKITLPSTLTTVDTFAFSGCSKLTQVCFNGSCSQWDDVTIAANNNLPTNITYGSHAYAAVVTEPTFTEQGYTTYSCSNCGDSYVGDYTDPVEYMPCGENAKWKIVNGTLYIEGTGAIENYTGLSASNGTYGGWYDYKDDIIAVDVGEGITAIGNWAFYNLTSVGTVYLPSTLTTIGSSSFRGMTALETVTIPDGVTRIDDYAFTDCSALAEIRIPNSVQRLGVGAFKDCESLQGVTLGTGLTSVTTMAFYGCTALESVIISEGVTVIGTCAFGACPAITTIDLPVSLTTVYSDAFAQCSSKIIVNYPGSYFDYKNITFEQNNENVQNANVKYGVPSGELNDGITWIIEDGVLTISGTGAPVVEWEAAPWAPYYETVTSVVMSDGITTVPSTAFTGFTKLTSVSIPDSVETIGQLAFKGCSALKDIELPDSLFLIGDEAFNGCSSITSLHYPAGLVTVGAYAFDGCTGLQNITVSADNTIFADTNGVLMNKDKTELIRYPVGRTDESYVVPSGVTKICTGAFAYSNLTAISIPASITTIDYAFEGCGNLKNVNYDGLRSEWNNLTINWNNSALYTAEFTFGTKSGVCGNNLEWVLKDCVLTISGTGVMTVAPWSAYAGDIDEIVLEEGVTTICDEAFYNCDNVTSVTIPEGVFRVGVGAFSGCDKLETVSIPSTMTLIMNYAFSDCFSLKSVDLPENTRQIGVSAFAGCTALTTVSMPGVRFIGGNAFMYSGLTSVVLPDTLTDMDIGIFEGCENLVSASLPTNLVALPGHTFKYCSNLAEFSLPDTVVEIGEYAFYQCSSLDRLTLPDTLTYLGDGVFSQCSSLSEIVILEGVSKIPNSTFQDCSSLASVTIPDSVTEIGSSAFSGCMSLKTVTIPHNVAMLGDYAFGDCLSLMEITFNGDSPTIGTNAFYYVPGADVLYPNNGYGWENIVNDTDNNNFGGVLYWKPYTGKTFVRGGVWCGTTWKFENGSLTIQVSGAMSFGDGMFPWAKFAPYVQTIVFEKGITVIADYAFKDFTALTELNLPDGLSQIYIDSFANCSSLKTIFFPASLSFVAGSSFHGCTALESFTYDGTNTKWNQIQMDDTVIKSIPGSFTDPSGCYENLVWEFVGEVLALSVANSSGNPEFYGHWSEAGVNINDIKCVVVNEGVNVIPMDAFRYHTGIVQVSLPSTLHYIDESAFYGCSGLTSITFPKGMTQICTQAFMDCPNLQSVTFPSTLVDISTEAFYNCPKLTEITLPKSLSSIGDMVFEATGLKTVNYGGTLIDWENIDIGSSNSTLLNATLNYHIPTGKCGDNLTWKLDGSELTISGTGAMYDNESPWGDYRTSIRTVTISSGVTYIGAHVFEAMINLQEVTLPKTVTKLGDYAFNDCGKLSKVIYDGTKYQFNSIDEGWSNECLVDASITCSGKLSAPTGLKASVVSSSGNIKLTWNKVNGAAKYEIYRATSSGGTYSKLYTTSSTSYTNFTGTPGTTYYYKVKAICNAGDGVASNYSSYVYKTRVCAQPVPKVNVVASSGNISLSWEPIVGASDYEIYRATSASGSYTKLYTTSSTSYTNSTGTPGTKYYYKVKAICGKSTNGNSALSSYVSAYKDCARPVVKASVVASSGNIKLSWNSVAGASKYEIYRATSATGSYTKMYTTSSTSYTNSTGTPGTKYYYKVKAICGKSTSGNSAYSSYVSAYKDCARPVVKASVVASSGDIKLTWNSVTGASKYEIYRATSATGSYTKMYTTSSTSYTNSTGTPGTKYYYKVKAICGKNSSGNSAYSSYVSAIKTCKRPVVSITRSSSGKPKLSWTKVTGATKYYVYRATSANGSYSYIGSTTGSTYTNSTAVKGKTYYYKVKAICGKSSYGNSALSTAKYIKAK